MDNNTLLNTRKVFAMLHLKGVTGKDIFDRALRETDIYMENGVDAVLVENYFGAPENVAHVLSHFQKHRPEITYGVNLLGSPEDAFEVALKYGAKFIQIDSVIGHWLPQADAIKGMVLSCLRQKYQIPLMGGVRFKYKEVLSGRALAEDLRVGMERCDAVVVTGAKTKEETPLEKIRSFKKTLGDFPLIVGAGVTPQNLVDSFPYAGGFIVGSYFKEEHTDTGEVDRGYVREFMQTLRGLKIDSLKKVPHQAHR
ncbi:MAG: membrane biogenesis protein [Lactobacillales bacterium]|jgi:predicted TIM-barrel enzyme|nr:membrane biogenesis protein [Lactobacillales bacterium]